MASSPHPCDCQGNNEANTAAAMRSQGTQDIPLRLHHITRARLGAGSNLSCARPSLQRTRFRKAAQMPPIPCETYGPYIGRRESFLVLRQ